MRGADRTLVDWRDPHLHQRSMSASTCQDISATQQLATTQQHASILPQHQESYNTLRYRVRLQLVVGLQHRLALEAFDAQPSPPARRGICVGAYVHVST